MHDGIEPTQHNLFMRLKQQYHPPCLHLLGWVLACYAAMTLLTMYHTHRIIWQADMAKSSLCMTSIILLFYLSCATIYLFIRDYIVRKKPIHVWTDHLSVYVTEEVGIRLLAAMSIFLLMAYCQVTLKASLPMLNHFSWDKTFIHWDQLLAGGQAPWQRLHGLLGYPWVTYALDQVYVLWFMVLPCIWTHQFFSDNRLLAMRFVLSMLIAWMVMGHGMAVLFLSKGPCFVYQSPWASTYHGLFQYLHHVHAQVPLWAINIQQALSSNTFPFNTIAAFPSMHVAMSYLIACYSRQFNRGWCVLGWSFNLANSCAAIHLGWHYACDVIASWIMVELIWYGVKCLVMSAHAMPVDTERMIAPGVLINESMLVDHQTG